MDVPRKGKQKRPHEKLRRWKKTMEVEREGRRRGKRRILRNEKFKKEKQSEEEK